MAKRRLTLREFDKKAAEILARMKAEATSFADDSESAKQKRKERARLDRLWFMQTYLPHYIYKPFGEIHEDLNNLLDVRDKMCFFAGPRESGKTTLDGLGVQLHDIYFGLRHFEIIISETDKQASDYAKFIKLEIEENPRLKQDFGELKGRYQWEDGDFVTRNNVRVLSRGRGQAIKGLRWRQYRPDRIVAIDLENMKTSRNPRIVKETISWISGEVLGGMARGGSFLMEGQIIRRKCVLAHFIGEKDEKGKPKYISRIWRAIQDDGTSYWPEGWTIEELLKRKKEMGSIEFNRWMQNNPSDEEGLFREEWIRYYHPEELRGRQLRMYGWLDASVGAGETSDYKAFISVATDDQGIIYVADAFIRKCSIDAMLHAVANRYDQLHHELIGIEDNVFQKLLLRDFRRLEQETGRYLPIRGYTNTMPKASRIASLSSLIERGIIRFQKGQGDQDLLIEQLVFYDEGQTVNDDGPDALEGAVRISQQVVDLVVAL